MTPRNQCAAGPLLASILLAAAPLTAQGLPEGTWRFRTITMTLGEGARYAFSGPAGELIAGAWRVESGTVVLRDDRGRVACLAVDGRYRVQMAADTLRFELVEDSCEGRRAALGGGAWIRVRAVVALTGGTLIDGTGAPPRPGTTLVLREGRVAAIHPDGAAPLPPDAEARSVAGMWVLPGLVDAHVHLATNPSSEDRRDRVEARLRNALRGGVVAVRDMAGDGRSLAGLARDALVGDLESPVIAYAALMAGPGFFGDPRVRSSTAGVTVGTAPWARAVTDTTDLRQVVAEARGTGATAVKLYADFDSALVSRLVAEARRQGLRTWAHLTLMPARPAAVVAARPDVVSHALLLAWAAMDTIPAGASRFQVRLDIRGDHPAVQRVLAQMREAGTIFDPTLWVYRSDPALPDTALPRRREARAVEFTRAAHRAGVRIAAGTDGLGSDSAGSLPNLHEEMRLLVERAGLTPMEAIVAATKHSAMAAGLEATHGTVEVGKTADLLVLAADPLTDIRNTRMIGLVVRRGKVSRREAATPP